MFTLKYTIEEPVATILNNSAMKAYLQLFKLAWALKRSEHSLNECWVDLNAVQRQLSAFPGYVKKTGAESYSEILIFYVEEISTRLTNILFQIHQSQSLIKGSNLKSTLFSMKIYMKNKEASI